MWRSIFLILMMVVPPVFAQDALSIAEKSEALYQRAGSFTTRFTQQVSTGGFFEDEQTSGVLLMEYPDRFRIETPEQVIACDGDTIWSYSVENKQVTIEQVDKTEDLVTPADYLFNFRENYNIAFDTTLTLNDIKTYKLLLHSKSGEDYVQSMELYVNGDTYAVSRVKYTDINDNIITIDFSDLELGTKIDSQRFRFKTPRGIEEVRLP
jgi:outer membrane lipoprotein-sorting protein